MKILPLIEWYVFCGNYRKFVVRARTKNSAITQFDIAAQRGYTHGFCSKDITRVLPKDGWRKCGAK